MDINVSIQYRNILDTSAPRLNADRLIGREREGWRPCCRPRRRTPGRTRSPMTPKIWTLMKIWRAQLMRQVNSAFKSEVSGADLRAGASKLKDMLAGLQSAAQGNTPLIDSTRHAGVTTMAARAATVRERGFLENDTCDAAPAPVTTGKRSRGKPSHFGAGATRVRGSRQLEKEPSPPPRAAPCPLAPRNRTDNAERARARRRKAAREAYAN